MRLGADRHRRGGGRWSWRRRGRCLNDGRSWQDHREFVGRLLRPDTGAVLGGCGHRAGYRCEDLRQRSWHTDSAYDGF
jgi:hypothetical protein